MARNVVNIEEVSKAFDIHPLLDGVSLGVSEGDRIGIVGRNGSGKSTLMKIIAGIEEPDLYVYSNVRPTKPLLQHLSGLLAHRAKSDQDRQSTT